MANLRQYQVTLACSLGNFIIGIILVWPSYTLHLYTDTNTTLLAEPLSDMQSALVGSLPSLGAMVSTMFAGVMLNTLGRQRVGLCVAMLFLLSWLLIDLSSSAALLLLGRFLSGLSCGVSFVLSPVFISEIADKSIRGLLAAAPTAFYCIGVFSSFLMGWLLTFKYIIWTNIFISVLYAALILSVRESPVFSLMKNNEEVLSSLEARKSIAYYKGMSADSKPVLEELSRLKQQLMPAFELMTVTADGKIDEGENEKLNPDAKVANTEKMPPYKMLLFSQTSRRAFAIVAITLSLQVMMGIVAVQVYASEIFRRAAPSLSSDMCSVLFSLVLMSGCLSCVFFSDKFGRKPLIIGSSAVVTICLLSMAFLLQTSIGPASIIAALILVFCFAFMFGAGSVPYVLLAELFLPEVQNLASMLLLELVWLLNFFLVGIFPYMIKLLDVHGSFYFFAIFGVLDILVGIFLVPETKGLSSKQIQEALQGRRKM